MSSGRSSLRVRVAAAAALGAVVVAAVVAAVLVVLLSHREVAALDRRLTSLTDALSVRVPAGSSRSLPEVVASRAARPLLRGLADGLVVTVRDGNRVRSAGTGLGAAPDLPATTGDERVGGSDYRVRTVPLADGATLTVGLPETATTRAVARVRRETVLIALAAAAGSAALGWLLAGPAVRPLRILRDRTAALSGRPDPAERAALTAGPVRTTAETAALADALAGLLDRVDAARAEGEQALQAARDFAAAASHELRTPLTTLRTDLDVLVAHPELPVAQRTAVLEELRGSQQRVEATLTALGQLAAGDLGDLGAAAPVDLADLAAQAVRAARPPEGWTVTAELPEGEVPVLGSEAGLRLAVDNLVTNAVRHSGGRRVVLTVGRDLAAGRAAVLVDDDGLGVPPAERERVFGRFVRGGSATAPGSGLGLALVAQQAGLHGGHAWLADSPLGGTRAVLDLPLAGWAAGR
ncbi:MAG TPA: HAMP domain-containing sensor histidine kinase [Blastococcus sp.]|jgi:two-component system sensor histidine kinase PrrB|nr:HAMP domain-containing sensor histidine kinase [Blastococcus sp.]